MQIDDLASVFADSEQLHLTDQRAAEELPHDSLERPEVLELLEGVFSTPLEAAIGPFDELPVVAFSSSHSALLKEPTDGNESNIEPSDEPVLFESTLPIKTEDQDGDPNALDLSLEGSGETFQPEAPLVDVEIPKDLAAGIRLPDSAVSVMLKNAPANRAPSLLGTSVAVYPNVAADTDFSVSPTPTGFETFTTLRTPDAPRVHTLGLNLPSGVSLEPASDGGAVARQIDGAAILRVHAPTAIDAKGDAVPVALTVDGGSLIIEATPGPGTTWPILVDPFFESYAWNTTSGGLSSWKPESSTALLTTPDLGNWFQPGNPVGTLKFGMYVKAQPGQYAWPHGANWWYRVPRLATEEANGKLPTSYIVGMSLTGIHFATSAGTASPYAIMGIYNRTNNTFAGQPGGQALWAYSGNAPAFNGGYLTVSNGEPGKRDELAQQALGAALWANETTSLPAARQLYVEGATVEVGDTVLPTSANPSVASAWVNNTATEPITVNAADSGLGVRSVQFGFPGLPPTTQTHPCAGTATNPCPSNWSPSLSPAQYSTANLPSGFNYVTIRTRDVLGNETPTGAAARAQLKVDHSAPRLALSGSLTEQTTVGVNLEKYTLKYTATDGDEAPAEALSSFGGAGTAPGKTELPIGVAVEANGNVLVVDRANKRVTRFDKDGNYLSQFGSAGTGNGQINDPTGIGVSPAGNIWVVEMANKRAQAFTPGGQFIRSITCACFSQPYAIAAGPNGAIWISDIGVDKLFKYNEAGTQLAVAHGNQADPAGTATDMSNVTGLAVDAAGGVWAAEYIMNKLLKFDSSGNYVAQIAPSVGSGDGQVVNPGFVAIAPSGNLMVVDYNNSRLQEFKPDGTFMRKFGSFGAGLGQMNAPQGPAFGPNGVLYVPDYLNHRVNRWAHADLDPQSGVIKAQIKVDGQAVKIDTQSCAKTCPLSNEWTLDADDYSVGQHTVEVIATDGVELSTPKALTIETHADLKDPMIALSGSMTEQASLGTTRPSYTLKVNATDPGAANERKSGVASVKVKVDGTEVKSTSPGCPAGGCSLATEWTLSSLAYSTGSHNVEVVATDAAGRTSTKSLAIEIAKDETPPTITAANAFYNAPEGWVEQKSYLVNATGKDENSYGITSISLKIDGQVVKSKTQECPTGGCSLPLGAGQTLDLASYDGGAHPAELRAVDGAGNVAKKVWTINVSPKGIVSPGEATDTMAAIEDTTSEEDARYDQTEALISDLETEAEPLLQAGEDDDLVTDASVPVSIASDPASGFTLRGAIEDSQEVMVDQVLNVEPKGLSPQAAGAELANNSAAVFTNTAPSVDTVVRPVYDGLLAFQVIRDATGPEAYEWELNLHPSQTLEPIDADHAGVFYSDGTQAFLIASPSARGADGSPVPTSLTVTGSNVITLTVHHNGVSSLSYPVTAGTAFHAGYSTVIFIPPPETEDPEGMDIGELVVSSPEPTGPLTGEEASSSGGGGLIKPWRVKACANGVPILGLFHCEAWWAIMRGFFRYNYFEAWYPNNRDPHCWSDEVVTYEVKDLNCEWVGPNHQVWNPQHVEGGPLGIQNKPKYHITAQMTFKAAKDVVIDDITSSRALTVAGEGDGSVYAWRNANVCNPWTHACSGDIQRSYK